jgi:E3 ubiquitin-protein ligase UBR1
MEIAQRGTGDGVGHELSPPVLGALSPQHLMLLRVLAQSIRTMLRYRMNIDGKKVWNDFYVRHFNRVIQLCPFGENTGEGTKLPSLLQSNMFERFVVASAVVPFTFGLDVGNLLLIHYVAEITKIALAILASKTAMTFIMNSKKYSTENIPQGPRSLLRFFISKSGVTSSSTLLSGLYHLLRRFILPFLRKAIIFVHVFQNVLFPKVVAAEDCESIRLCHLLGLPSLAEVLDMDTSANNILFTMIQNWIAWWRKDHSDSNVLKLEHPAVFEVIGLPKRLDTLLELASKFRCPKCRLVPDEPAMCLLCGDIVCTQAICCDVNGTGEMNLHREQF